PADAPPGGLLPRPSGGVQRRRPGHDSGPRMPPVTPQNRPGHPTGRIRPSRPGHEPDTTRHSPQARLMIDSTSMKSGHPRDPDTPTSRNPSRSSRSGLPPSPKPGAINPPEATYAASTRLDEPPRQPTRPQPESINHPGGRPSPRVDQPSAPDTTLCTIRADQPGKEAGSETGPTRKQAANHSPAPGGRLRTGHHAQPPPPHPAHGQLDIHEVAASTRPGHPDIHGPRADQPSRTTILPDHHPGPPSRTTDTARARVDQSPQGPPPRP
ncbi:hypothetical protein SAMN05444858_1151, partial [Micromonospora avicenniae]